MSARVHGSSQKPPAGIAPIPSTPQAPVSEDGSNREKRMFDEALGRSPLVLTIPGLGNSGPEHWQTIWERDRRDCERVPLGCWDNPSRNVWVGRIDQAVRSAPCPVVLAAHSLGCLAVIWWVRTMGEATAADIVGALLVAPPNVNRSEDPRIAAFGPAPRGLLPFPSIVVASRNDPYCAFECAKDLAAGWGADFVDLGAVGHINSVSGLGRWAEGQALLGGLLHGGEARAPRSAIPPAQLAQPR